MHCNMTKRLIAIIQSFFLITIVLKCVRSAFSVNPCEAIASAKRVDHRSETTIDSKNNSGE